MSAVLESPAGADLMRRHGVEAGQVQEGEELLRTVLARSATDRAFRAALLSSPRQAIAEFTGKEVSADFNVAFIENKADATIVLPDPVDPELALTDEELQTVAGGSETVALTLSIVASAIYLYRCIAR